MIQGESRVGPGRVKKVSVESQEKVQRESREGLGRVKRILFESQERLHRESGEGPESLDWVQ